MPPRYGWRLEALGSGQDGGVDLHVWHCGPGALIEHYMADHGLRRYTEYHPGSSFLTMQMLESAVFLGLAAALLATAVWIVRRRTASNSSFSYQYYCGSPRTIPWGFVLSARNQATVVGSVNETGLRWWCNSAFVGQNAPHTVPPSYTFHGTMNPVAGGCRIDFQDYMTWRHNIGPGGTASLAVAGSLYLVN